MKRILLLFSALMLSCIALWAHDVEIDGIYYNLDETNKTARVTYRGNYHDDYDDEYRGSVTIPETITYYSQTYSVKYIVDFAFYDCSKLTSVTIPNSVTGIGSNAFYGCSELTSVTIPNSVTDIGGGAFSGCSGLTEVTIPNSVTYIGQGAFYNTGIYNNNSNWDNGVLYIDNCLIEANNDVVKGSYTIKEGTRIVGGGAFSGCSGLTSVTIPNSVTDIGSDAFSGCSGLTEVTIPNSVTYIGSDTFRHCSSLTSVTIPNSVTFIDDYAFDGCSGLTKVNYLGTVDEWVEFNWLFGNPTSYANDLYINNELVTDVKITSAGSIGYGVFNNCKSIKSVEIGESVTSIGLGAFSGCSGLTEITIGESVTSIDYDAFSGCSGLTEVTIPNSVTHIGEGAFFGCSGLTEVTIGESVTSIGSSAFSGCDKLIKVTAYPTTVPNAYESSFAHYNAALYVPCDVYDDYILDDVFGTFKVTECIAGEEVDAPEKVEIEVDEDNNAIVIWPSTDGAKKYKLEISKDGEVFCTLLFNENGQLTSIDFGNRSASVGFQFTVTGLDSASKYAYSMVAMDKKGNELQSYKGTFTTNGYVPGSGEEDEPSAIIETLADANITVSGGTISADADFSIYNTIGQDVTSFNGSLQPGIYVVALGEDRVKIMIK